VEVSGLEPDDVLRLNRAVPPVVLGFAIGIVAVAALAILRYLVGAEGDLLKLGEESNLPTWLSSIQLFTIAAVLVPLAYRDIDRERRGSWALALVPIFFAVLSLDEAATLHERLGSWLTTEFEIGADLRSGPWIFLFAPLAAVFAVVAALQIRPYLKGHRRAIRLAVGGAAIYGLAAVGLEVAANFVVEDSFVHRSLAFSEEIGELAGVNLMLWSAILVIRREGIRLDLGDAS
jgi:hypothetical protein